MMKYLLFKGLGPDDLPTLKQLTTNGKALAKLFQELSQSQDDAETLWMMWKP